MATINSILNNALEFDDKRRVADFIGSYKELYKIPLFKIGLDAILTKAELGLVSFHLQPQDSNNNLHGCCITQERRIFHKIFNAFVKNYTHQINIKSLSVEVLMHEIAHALEKESKLELSQEFAHIFKEDLRNIVNSHMNIQRAIKQIIFKELDLYPQYQHNSEMLARFYELLAMSKEIASYHGDFPFKLNEICAVFPNTITWIKEKFNQNLKTRVADHIAKLTENITFDQDLGSFSRKHKAKHSQNSKWSGNNIKSIFD